MDYLPSSGAIKFSDLQTVFGGSNPISLSEYYKGGSLVPTGLSYSNYSTGISGGYYSNASRITIACTYGTPTSRLTAPYVASKQWFGYVEYGGADTVTIGGYYSGSSTGYPNGQIALQGIARTN